MKEVLKNDYELNKLIYSWVNFKRLTTRVNYFRHTSQYRLWTPHVKLWVFPWIHYLLKCFPAFLKCWSTFNRLSHTFFYIVNSYVEKWGPIHMTFPLWSLCQHLQDEWIALNTNCRYGCYFWFISKSIALSTETGPDRSSKHVCLNEWVNL